MKSSKKILFYSCKGSSFLGSASRRFSMVLAVLLVANLTAASTEYVEITQKKSKKTLSVKILSFDGSEVSFVTRQGKKYTIDPSLLTEDSLKLLKSKVKAESTANQEPYSKVNASLGHPLFVGANDLWKEPAGEVAKRLGWPKESQTDQSSSYRYYPPMNYQFLGTHPYSATLYGGNGGSTSHLSLVFANKGDFGSRAGMGPDHFKKLHPEKTLPNTLEETIEMDAELISESLSSALGNPVKQYYGEKEDRRKVKRWNLDSHAFLLSEVEGEYTSLLVVSKKNADMEGKVAFVKDSELKKIVSENVKKNENGDTFIDNIPMVNQGPKGYCAPATFERAMRYMLVPADMYLLATLATSAGGGTNTVALADSCKRIVRSKARRIKDLNLEKDLKMRKVKTYIDKGVPILWCMRSLKEYNAIANSRSKERASVKDFSQWKETIALEAENVAERLAANEMNHHICMIIGYNEETNELAVSDSWGARYALRWVHIDIAKAVTSRGGFVIDL